MIGIPADDPLEELRRGVENLASQVDFMIEIRMMDGATFSQFMQALKLHDNTMALVLAPSLRRTINLVLDRVYTDASAELRALYGSTAGATAFNYTTMASIRNSSTAVFSTTYISKSVVTPGKNQGTPRALLTLEINRTHFERGSGLTLENLGLRVRVPAGWPLMAEMRVSATIATVAGLNERRHALRAGDVTGFVTPLTAEDASLIEYLLDDDWDVETLTDGPDAPVGLGISGVPGLDGYELSTRVTRDPLIIPFGVNGVGVDGCSIADSGVELLSKTAKGKQKLKKVGKAVKGAIKVAAGAVKKSFKKRFGKFTRGNATSENEFRFTHRIEQRIEVWLDDLPDSAPVDINMLGRMMRADPVTGMMAPSFFLHI